VRFPFFFGIWRRLCPYTSPFLEPVYNAINVRLLVKYQGAQTVALVTALVVYDSVVSIPWVSPYYYGYLLAEPAAVRAFAVFTNKSAHDMSRIGVISIVVSAFLVEPWRYGVVGNSFRNIVMEFWKHEPHLAL